MAGLGVLTACSVPDYTPVRDWAGTASVAADFPPVAADAQPDGGPRPTERSLLSDSILAMQEALSVYLNALGTIAADGVLPYREDPFVDLARRATLANPDGGHAIAELGSMLRSVTRHNARAPELRDTIRTADPPLQALVAALNTAVTGLEAHEAEERRAVAADYARMRTEARAPFASRAVRDLGELRDRELAIRTAARANYRVVLTRIAEGHALLKARARHITQEESIRQIRAADDQLRRASAVLPRTLLAPAAAGPGPGPQVPYPVSVPAAPSGATGGR